MSDTQATVSPRPAGAAASATPGAYMSKIHPNDVPGAAFSVLIAHASVLMQGHDTPGSVAYWITQASASAGVYSSC
jgi:hypothetical protein